MTTADGNDSACRAAMAMLRNGGSAIDGVEIALRSLEDNEITNAGYGSNLALDGSVECDASIMDETGRSGAVGAVESASLPTSLPPTRFLTFPQTSRTPPLSPD